jgi:hypothetical protein
MEIEKTCDLASVDARAALRNRVPSPSNTARHALKILGVDSGKVWKTMKRFERAHRPEGGKDRLTLDPLALDTPLTPLATLLRELEKGLPRTWDRSYAPRCLTGRRPDPLCVLWCGAPEGPPGSEHQRTQPPRSLDDRPLGSSYSSSRPTGAGLRPLRNPSTIF